MANRSRAEREALILAEARNRNRVELPVSEALMAEFQKTWHEDLEAADGGAIDEILYGCTQPLCCAFDGHTYYFRYHLGRDVYRFKLSLHECWLLRENDLAMVSAQREPSGRRPIPG